eukprot:TRINITY_DN17454_c0_g1_i1.p1 TRINITY_DN17454_c0_g1~~TRINITY_DN17454_c0_g1_i1.p1  ORF type:complete len:933 (-),score=149.72 TRINITY_DN17454_c0_g1_i1:620-3418(-)
MSGMTVGVTPAEHDVRMGVEVLFPRNNLGSSPRQPARHRSQRAASSRCFEGPCCHPANVQQPGALRAVSLGHKRGGPVSRSRGPSRGRSRGACGGNHRAVGVCGASLIAPQPSPATANVEESDVCKMKGLSAECDTAEPTEALGGRLLHTVELSRATECESESESDDDACMNALSFCASDVISGLLDGAVDDYAEETVREIIYANEAPQVFPEFEPPIPEVEDEDAEDDAHFDAVSADFSEYFEKTDTDLEEKPDPILESLSEYECEGVSGTNESIAAALTLSVVLEAVGGIAASTAQANLSGSSDNARATSSDSELFADLVKQDEEEDAVSVVSSPVSDSDNDDAPVIVQRIAEDIVFDSALLPKRENDDAKTEPTWAWPCARLLGPCSRPRFERRLRPSLVGSPVPAEPFPMDCFPLSAPVASSLAPAAELTIAGRRLAGLPVTASRLQPPFFSADSSKSFPRLSAEAEKLLLMKASESLAALASKARLEAARAIQRRWLRYQRQRPQATKETLALPASTLSTDIVAPVQRFQHDTPVAPSAPEKPRVSTAPRRRMLGSRGPSTCEATPVVANDKQLQETVAEATVIPRPSTPAMQVAAATSPSPRAVPPSEQAARAGLTTMIPSAPSAPKTSRPGPRPGLCIRTSGTAQEETQSETARKVALSCVAAATEPHKRAAEPTSGVHQTVLSADALVPPLAGGPFSPPSPSPRHSLRQAMESGEALSPRPPSSRPRSRPSSQSGALRGGERAPQPHTLTNQGLDVSMKSTVDQPPRPPPTPRTPRPSVGPVSAPTAGQRCKRFPGTVRNMSAALEESRNDKSLFAVAIREPASTASAMELDLGIADTVASPWQSSSLTSGKVFLGSPRQTSALPSQTQSPRTTKPAGTGLLPALPTGPSMMTSAVSWGVGMSTFGVTSARSTNRSTSASRRLR